MRGHFVCVPQDISKLHEKIVVIQPYGVSNACGLDDLTRGALALDGKSDYLKPFTMKFVQSLEIRHFFDAGRAPRGKKVDDERCPGVLGERGFCAIERRVFQRMQPGRNFLTCDLHAGSLFGWTTTTR